MQKTVDILGISEYTIIEQLRNRSIKGGLYGGRYEKYNTQYVAE